MLNGLKLKHIIVLFVTLVVILLIISYGIYATKALCHNNDNNDEAPFNYRRPMVYVEDNIYYESKYVKLLPEGADLIGSIEKVILPSELPKENFTSNTELAPLGSPVYADDDNLSVIYIEILDLEAGGYIKYVTESELLSETSD